MLSEVDGWTAVGLAALGCCIFAGFVGVGLSTILKSPPTPLRPLRMSRPHPELALSEISTNDVIPRYSPVSTFILPRLIRWDHLRAWLSRHDVIRDDAESANWTPTEHWLDRRVRLYRTSTVVLMVASVGVVGGDVVLIPSPLFFRNDAGVLIGVYVVLVIVGGVMSVVSAFPWRLRTRRERQEDEWNYWLNLHPGRYFSAVGAIALVLGVSVVVALANGLGGDVGFIEINRHYFETNPGAAPVPISYTQFTSAVRASGLSASVFFLFGALGVFFVGSSLHRASAAASGVRPPASYPEVRSGERTTK